MSDKRGLDELIVDNVSAVFWLFIWFLYICN